MALSSQKENKEYKDNLILSITESINTIYSKLGDDIIFESSFELVPIENVWPSCAGESAAILNGNEDRSILAQGPGVQPTNYNGYYSDIYNNTGSGTATPWPGPLGANISLNLEKNHYIAAQFNTPDESIDAKFLSQMPSNYQGVAPQAYTVSISECPGDFNVHLSQTACKTNAATFKWSTTPNPPGPPGFFCELEKNKTYYLNIVHSNNASNDNHETSDCLSQVNSCGHLSSQSLIIIR